MLSLQRYENSFNTNRIMNSKGTTLKLKSCLLSLQNIDTKT